MSTDIVPKNEAEHPEIPARPVFPRAARVIAEEPPEPQISFTSLWRMFCKRKWFLVASTGVCFALALLVTLVSTSKYRSTSTIEFNKENSDALDLNDARTGDANSMDYVVAQQTQVNALKSDDLALQVVNQLGLERRKEFKAKQFISDYFHTFPNEANLPLQKAPHRRAEALKMFQKNLKVDILPGTRMITVQYFSPDPQVAADVVNTLVSDYQEQYMRVRMSATMQVSDWLSKQLDDLKAQVEGSQQRLVDYQKQAGILGADESHNIVMTRLEEVDKQLTEARGNRILAQAVAQLARTGNPELISGLVGNSATYSTSTMPSTLSLIEQLRAEQAQLRSQYAQAASQFGPAYPKLIELQSQLRDLDDSIKTESGVLVARAQNDLLAAQQTESGLAATFEQAKVDANQMNDNSVHYTVLKHELESSRDLYDELQKKLKEAGVLAGLRSTNVVILDPGLTSDRPARPIIPLNLGFGVFAGLLIGVGGVFVLENIDETISTPDDAEQITMVPSLGMIPRWKRPSKAIKSSTPAGVSIRETKILVASQPNSQAAEAYRAIRTAILEVTRRGVSNVLLVTSALPEEGKTTTSLNCAAAFAQLGARVLFVEADMRRPKVSALLNVDMSVGLSSLLGEEKCLDLPLRVPSMPRMCLIPAGPRTTYPAELLGTPRMAELVTQWRSEYDFVVIDTPPVLSVTDAVVLAPLCDAVILVARSHVTKRQALHRARSLFLRTRTRVAGVVLNGFDIDSPDYGAYYGFENKSEAGQGYFESKRDDFRKGMLS